MSLMKKVRGGKGDETLAGPGGGLSLFRRELDRAFDRARGAFDRWPLAAFEATREEFWPPMDVSEDESGMSVRVDVPGLDPKDLEVEVSGDVLTIKGSRTEEAEQKDDGRYRHERFAGSFCRAVALPPSVDAGKVRARYDKGVLTVTAPRVPGAEPKKVAVTT